MSKVDEQEIREALRQVVDPELDANIVDLNMIREIKITGEKVKIGLVLRAPDCPLSGWITQQI
ncbi:MAG: iron-sulfur cluster assembly protein [Bacteroidales bacterium]